MKTQEVLFGYSLLVLLPFSVIAMQEDPYESGHQLFRKAEYTAAHKKYSELLQKKVGSEDQQDAAVVSDAQCCIGMAINKNDDELLQEGFKKFDQRIPLEVRSRKRKPLRKPWKKGFDPKDKNVLVLGEYGFGDTFSFAQFLPVLKRLGAHVTVLP